jgi:hypothetical protein
MKSFLQYITEIGDTPAGVAALKNYQDKRLPQVGRRQERVKSRLVQVKALVNSWKLTGDPKTHQRASGLLNTTIADNDKTKRQLTGLKRAETIVRSTPRNNENI